MGRLEQHVAVRARHFDVTAVQVVVEVDVLGLAARTADHDHLAGVRGQRHRDRHRVGNPGGVGDDLRAAGAQELRQLSARAIRAGLDDVIGPRSQGRLAAHADGVDADDRVGTRGDQAAQRELADDTQSQHHRGPPQGQAGADRRPEAVARDARHRRLVEIEPGRHPPPAPALMANRQ